MDTGHTEDSEAVKLFKTWASDRLSYILGFEMGNDYIELLLNKTNEEARELLINFVGPDNADFVGEFLIKRPQRYLHTGISIDENIKSHFGHEEKGLQPGPSSQKGAVAKKSKKKTKYVEFQTNSVNEAPLLKGRYKCDCEARKHKLINNCLQCGRIVCHQEGSGPCLFCGTLVCTTEEEMALKGSDVGKASQLYEELLTKDVQVQQEDEAIKARDKMLEYDKNWQKYLHVFDDDCDWFDMKNPWLTVEEKDRKKKEEEDYWNKKNAEESHKTKLVNLNLNFKKSAGIFSSITAATDENLPNFRDPMRKHITKIVDLDADLDLGDENGYCLCIRQPFASFVIYGIKNFEGRTWHSDYKGPLWIASSATPPSGSDISMYERTYRMLKGEDVAFPPEYPTGCLLGRVDMVECLSQEEYREKWPQGEVEDPFVFVFKNAKVLPTRFPIQGKQNIFKLRDKIKRAAEDFLLRFEHYH